MRYAETTIDKVVNLVMDGLDNFQIRDETGLGLTTIRAISKDYVEKSGFTRPSSEGNEEFRALNDDASSENYKRRARAIHRIKVTALEDEMFDCPEPGVESSAEIKKGW